MAKGGFRGGMPMGGGMNMNMMKQAQKMQQELLKMQQEMETKEFSATSGGGMVTATVNGKHEVIGSFAGDIHKAHEAGCEFVKSLAGVEPVECEIAITTNGGYPLDQNIYQAVKGMCSAEATLPEGGVIIDVAGCADGHGGEGFYHNIADNDPAEFERACIDRPKDETLPDQWTSQIFARILAHHPVIMVTDLCDHQMIKDMHMTPVNTLDEALKLAFEMKGADAKVAVIPDGLGVVVARH